jgi:hypothetical protein
VDVDEDIVTLEDECELRESESESVRHREAETDRQTQSERGLRTHGRTHGRTHACERGSARADTHIHLRFTA